ncbi:TetR/AcrR family transcriptional regulator [Pusillimonas sp. SM2304]|uniref:TetR/AcrR family transcriptional regulator n=1 Tax=Pusillimonas sp. SM2304 TaxID=3073241 RepID=UPI002876917E|nr:TetR/AcrR family transcriptional regulator [Pusillimonas sp. SM2304]MDS1139585.1 TetR/AcrR family transcriptional regulator [Pusillimonas sp. SM2304]
MSIKKPTKTKKRPWAGAAPRLNVRDLKLDAIYREAAACFRHNGYHGTSLEVVAQRLGVGKATLYHYFSNKQELLFQCHMVAADQAIAAVSDDTDISGLERLRLSMKRYTESIIGPESYSVVILEERSLAPDQLKLVIEKRDEFERRLQAVVLVGQADGTILPCDPKFAVFAALGAANWVTKWYRSNGSWTIGQVADAMSHFIVRGLAAGADFSMSENPIFPNKSMPNN